MQIDDLRDSVNGIYMKDEMRRKIIENVKKRTEGKTRKSTGWHKTAAAAAILIVVSGVLAFPVRAFVNSLVKERLVAMPEEEVDAIIEREMSIRAAADSFSRSYTDDENRRYQILMEKYQSGTFPEKEITQVDGIENVKPDEVCFVVPDSAFYLPERELTDEEILELIDFDVKRNYALEQNQERENAEELALKKEEQKKEIEDNVASGGITQQQAEELAAKELYSLFESNGEGMELNSYFNEGGQDGTEESSYNVNWTNIVTHKIYYINLSARDGRVLWAAQTNPESLDDIPDPTIEEANEKIAVLQKQAEAFMEKRKIAYEKVYVYYLKTDGGMAWRDGVRFVFAAADGAAYGVTYCWDGTLDTYAEVDFADYQDRDGKPRTLHRKGEEVQMMQVFSELNAGQDVSR